MGEILQLPINPEFSSGKTGIPYATSKNFEAMLKAHKITIRYNEISKQLEVDIPHRNYSTDNHLNCCIAELISMATEYKMGATHIQKYMGLIGDKNKFSPVIEWIEEKPWDGRTRLKEFFSTLFSTNEEMKDILLTRWMVSAVAAAYEPKGISAGGILVLYGKQYLGKTNWFKNLVPENKSFLIKDSMLVDPHSRDSMLPCLEHWLVELGEIDATFKRADLAALKAFITSKQDIMRLSYAPANSRFPRRTVFFGSVDKKSYLTDPAGNRRFWTVECKDINHTHGMDMQQVWAEVAVLYHQGEPFLLTKKEHELLTEANKHYEAVHPIEDKILRRYDWEGDIVQWKTATQILEELGYTNCKHGDVSLCGSVVRKLNGDKSKHVKGSSLLGLPHQSTEGLF